jgi:hypothetical protein
MTVKNLNELFNGIRGIVDNPGDQNIDPDTAWFKDLNNRRDLHKENPNAFAHYSPKTDTPQFPIVNHQTGRPCIKTMLHSMAQALAVQAQDPNIAGIDDIIHKLEKIIQDYRQDLTEIPEYRVDIVRSQDTTPGVNNLVYGPYQPNQKLAVMVSDMDPNAHSLDLGTVRVNTNNAVNRKNDLPVDAVNGVGDRVNVVQKTNERDLVRNDIETMLRNIAVKTAQLASQKKREEDREKTFTG